MLGRQEGWYAESTKNSSVVERKQPEIFSASRWSRAMCAGKSARLRGNADKLNIDICLADER